MAAIMIIKLIIANDKVLITPIPNKKNGIPTIKTILKNAIESKGTTFIDFSYANNQKGTFKNQLKVFGRQNQPCLRCNHNIRKIFIAQRGTHYCEKCQKYYRNIIN